VTDLVNIKHETMTAGYHASFLEPVWCTYSKTSLSRTSVDCPKTSVLIKVRVIQKVEKISCDFK